MYSGIRSEVMAAVVNSIKLVQSARNKSTFNPASSRLFVSQLFQNLGKHPPPGKDSALGCKSQKLLLYSDIVANSHSGCYIMLPLGQRALDKLFRLVDQEMQDIGGQKISLPSLAPRELWQKSGRWDSTYAELFKLQDRHKQEYCLGPTHEEIITNLVSTLAPFSYKRLPLRFYQITRKFRDEMRPKNLLLRGREFEMKDMYTFDETEESSRVTYDSVSKAYVKIFNRLNVPFVKVSGDTGNIGGNVSHEYHLLSDIGEDTLFICDKCSFGSNRELIIDGQCVCPNSDPNCELRQSSGIEIGHTFLLGTKYSSVFNAKYLDRNDKSHLMQMGCYGIGVSRLLQGTIEVLSTDTEIRWPKIIAPYQVCIIPKKISKDSEESIKVSETLSDALNSLPNLTREVVIDDRSTLSVGKRLIEARKIGFPYIIVVGKKAVESEPLFEVFETPSQEPSFLSIDSLKDLLTSVETL